MGQLIGHCIYFSISQTAAIPNYRTGLGTLGSLTFKLHNKGFGGGMAQRVVNDAVMNSLEQRISFLVWHEGKRLNAGIRLLRQVCNQAPYARTE